MFSLICEASELGRLLAMVTNSWPVEEPMHVKCALAQSPPVGGIMSSSPYFPKDCVAKYLFTLNGIETQDLHRMRYGSAERAV
ncbi:hypothetical protein TNCV_2541851 [Trichonephila clavipes]|nr:hypothetical protein TNCV_2541851 [Trichonephila clavipes]